MYYRHASFLTDEISLGPIKPVTSISSTILFEHLNSYYHQSLNDPYALMNNNIVRTTLRQLAVQRASIGYIWTYSNKEIEDKIALYDGSFLTTTS